MKILKDNIIIEMATLTDWEILVNLQLKMAWETEKLALNQEILSSGVKNLLADENKGKYYKLTDNQKIIGCMLNTLEWSDWRDGWIIWIQSLYILPEYRGQGLYRLMYEYIQEIVSQSPDYKGVRLYVDKTNVNAIEVYKSLGMNNQHYELFEWMK
jgi:ribosomal protein S18 acetylase RimI-like enzyme